MSRSIIACVSVLACATGCITPLPQQEPIPEAVRVRVTAAPIAFSPCAPSAECVDRQEPRPHDGTLIALSDDSLTLYARSHGRRVSLAVSSITKVEIYRGRKGSAGAAVKDAGIGGLLGAGFGALAGLGSAAIADALFPWGQPDYGRAAAEGAADGAATGIVIGAVYGATAGEAVWEEVTLLQLRQELCHCEVPPPVAQTP